MGRLPEDRAPVSAAAPAPQRRELCVVVVTYNSAAFLQRMVASLQSSAAPLRIRPVIVDNDSSDDTVQLARSLGLDVLDAGGNLGYSAAINLARAHMVPGADLLVLNPDLVLSEGAVTQLLAAVQDPDIGVALPRLRDRNGEVFPHLRREPSVVGALGDALLGSRWRTRPRWLTESVLRADDYQSDRDVAWGGGAALLITADCNERVGEWAEDRYFLYAEETDFQRRARNAGFRIRYVSTAEVSHHGGGSGTNAGLLTLMSVNRVRYFGSFNRPVATLAYRVVVVVRHLLRSRAPAHRFAARVVADKRRWDSLPGPTWRTPGGTAPARPARPCDAAPSRRPGDVIPTVCFHGVGAPGRPLESGEERFWIDPDVLHRVLDVVSGHPGVVELTVDDANASDVEFILPALLRRDLTAKFFVISDRIGQPGSLSETDIRELHRAGMTIGTHGATHRPWRDLDPSQLDTELRESMGALTAITGERVRFAACPLGSYSRSVLTTLRNFGLERVYTVDGGATRSTAWTRSRYTITKFDTAETISAWLEEPRGSQKEHWSREFRSAVKRWR